MSGVFLFVNTHPIRPNDFWFHLAYGRILTQTGQIPSVDLFSFTMDGQPYLSAYNYWLAQWLMYQIFAYGGVEWEILAFSLLVTLAYGLVLLLCLRVTGNWRLAAAGALFAAATGITNWNIRPQLLAYPLAAFCMLGINAVKSGQRPRLWMILLFGAMAVWVNCHATFFIPLALAGFWLADAALDAIHRKQPGVVVPALETLAVLAAGALVNPRGLAVFDYLYKVPQLSVQIYEWQPAWAGTPEGAIFFVSFLMLVGTWLAARRRLGLAQVLSFVFFSLLALKYARAVVWFGLTQAPFFVVWLQAAAARLGWTGSGRGKTQKRVVQASPFLNFALVAFFIFLSLASLPWLRAYWPLSPQKADIYAAETPVKAAAYLFQHNLPARVFSDIGFSSYLIWACGPQCRVFADPRFDLYPSAIWDDYIRLGGAAAGWEARLLAYRVDTLLLSRKTQGALIEAARHSADWRQVYDDDVAVAFVRRR